MDTWQSKKLSEYKLLIVEYTHIFFSLGLTSEDLAKMTQFR